MPTSSLAKRFDDLRRIKEKRTLTDLGTLAHYYGVSMEALTLLLEDMNLLPTGTCECLRARGFKVDGLGQRLYNGAFPARAHRYPLRNHCTPFQDRQLDV